MHIVVHYTVPGASFAAGLAQTLSPALDAVGLTSVFSQSAATASTSSLATLPSLGDLAVAGP